VSKCLKDHREAKTHDRSADPNVVAVEESVCIKDGSGAETVFGTDGRAIVTSHRVVRADAGRLRSRGCGASGRGGRSYNAHCQTL
jgi:hypothetical protein